MTLRYFCHSSEHTQFPFNNERVQVGKVEKQWHKYMLGIKTIQLGLDHGKMHRNDLTRELRVRIFNTAST